MSEIYCDLRYEPYNAPYYVITYSVHGFDFEDCTIVLISNQKQLLVNIYCVYPQKYLHIILIKIVLEEFAKSFPNRNIKLISDQMELSFGYRQQFILANCPTVESILGEWLCMMR